MSCVNVSRGLRMEREKVEEGLGGRERERERERERGAEEIGIIFSVADHFTLGT